MTSSSAERHFFGPTSYRKARPAAASASSSGFQSLQRHRLIHSQPPSSAERSEILSGDMTRGRSEKEILQTLNDRFAGYIDKVRSVEMHNRNLEEEAAALRRSLRGGRVGREPHERELGELRDLLQRLTRENGGAALEREHLEEDVEHLRARLEDEARHREDAVAAARAMKKYAEECRRARLELDKKLRALEEEDVFLKRNHEEEVAELLAQIQGEQQVSFDARDAQKADLPGALREIRAQLCSHTSRSSTHAEEWFKVRIERLSDAARSNQDALRGTQGEIAEYRRQLQSRAIELETLRGTKESLERQRMDSEDRHQDDLNSLQETINQLDNELKTTKWEMASQLRDYQELLNVKMALDIEIAAYRKLLEGEENRFVSGGSPSYSYPQSRIPFPTHVQVKGDEISDTVIVGEQTDETEVTEEAGEDGGEEKIEEEEEEAGEEEETKEDKADGEEGVENAAEDEGKEEWAGKKGEDEEKGEEEDASEDKGKFPQPKSPAVKSPESKSPAAKSPMPKSPESKSPPMTPENEKAKPVVARDTLEKEKKVEKPQPVKEETKEKEQPAKGEKNEEPKEETTTGKLDTKKEREANEAPKTDDTSKPISPGKPAEDKAAPKERAAPATKEKPSAPKPEGAGSKPKPAPEVEPEKKMEEKGDKMTEERSTAKAKPESAESKRDEEKPEEKKETSKDESKEAKEGGKAEKTEKSSGTESKEGKEEKVRKKDC